MSNNVIVTKFENCENQTRLNLENKEFNKTGQICCNQPSSNGITR